MMWTVEDPRVEGWLPWHYQSGPPGYGSGSPPHESGDYYGAASSPKVLAYLRAVGAPSLVHGLFTSGVCLTTVTANVLGRVNVQERLCRRSST